MKGFRLMIVLTLVSFSGLTQIAFAGSSTSEDSSTNNTSAQTSTPQTVPDTDVT